MMLKISLAKWNNSGAVAGIEDDNGCDSVDIVLHRSRCNAKTICLEAAKRLRKLADDFERLSEMDEPFREPTQRKAAKLPRENK